jgi:hypothetical protein
MLSPRRAARLANGAGAVDTDDTMFEVELFACVLCL